ncbi:MAG TPA: glycosyltransferase family 2 protein [Ideonella sp.]|nr:glycosyltransferase family 2 protein [Ideonella sp.]
MAADEPGADCGASLAEPASAGDLAQLYRLFLGREAEPAVLASTGPRPLHELAAEMAASEEINQCVLHALAQQRPLPHQAFDDSLLDGLADWLDARLPIAGEARGAPAMRGTVAGVLGHLYAHARVARWLLAAHGSLFTQALEELALLRRAGPHRFEGKIEFANRDFISGWAVDRSGRLPRLQLEIRHGGRAIASALASSHRPDIHQRLGGEGLVGFRARWSPARLPTGQALDLSLHEASTGAQIGEPYRYANSVVDQLGVAQLLAKEFEEIQRRLDTLAGMVPQALGYAAFPLAHFDLYRRVHRVPPPAWLATGAAGEEPLHATVLIDAAGAGPAALRLSIDSLREQQGPSRWQAWVVGGDTTVREAAAALAASDPRVSLVPDLDTAQAQAQSLASDPNAWLMLLQAGELLDAHALAWLTQAAATEPAPCLVYWDEDRVEHRGKPLPLRQARHADPILRSAFDPDAMLELNVVGTSFAMHAAALARALDVLARHPLDSSHPLSHRERERLVWALHGQGALTHLPHFLLTRSELAAPDEPVGASRLVAHTKATALEPLLPAVWQGRRWQREPDPIAGGLPKPLVHWQPRAPDAVLSVLIPTRDHGELVRQCVDSLHTLAVHPQALDIVIADNGSTDAATLAYLAQAQAAGRLRVLRIDEPFNWSRLNNRLAEAARGDQLLFLNNDTRMLTRGWDELLRGLLERPDVGAVGARLLYEDMSIQHAGIVFGFEGFVGHEAVERRPDDPLALFDSQLTRQVSGVTGAFLACRREVFAAVGGFDAERLSVTFNDVDWCLRVTQAGLKVLYAPALSLVHYESKSRGFDFMSLAKQQRADHERELLLRKHPAAFGADPFRHPAISGWVHGEKSLS